MKEQMLQKFEELYGQGGDIKFYFAPGRVNLIGEHTDYNGGHVFPCTLTLGTYMAVRIRKDHELRFYSMNYGHQSIVHSSVHDLEFRKDAGWTNYPKGVIWTFMEKGYFITQGMDILLYGNIPKGSGLSSSASIEVLMGVMLKELFGFDLSLVDIALLGQYAENHFIGVNCGIMDQFAIAMGRKDHAMFLDTSDLSYEYAPIQLEDKRIIITSSNKKRGLVDSEYNRRIQECKAALRDLQAVLDISTLGELTEEAFENAKEVIQSSVCVRRARHAVYENQRTMKAVQALKHKNIMLFGDLMNESHKSLRDDYEVTGIELDTLVESAWAIDGVIGSRMTGAGFGGCTVSIVKEDKVEYFIERVGREYMKKIGYIADFYVVDIGDGARKL